LNNRFYRNVKQEANKGLNQSAILIEKLRFLKMLKNTKPKDEEGNLIDAFTLRRVLNKLFCYRSEIVQKLNRISNLFFEQLDSYMGKGFTPYITRKCKIFRDRATAQGKLKKNWEIWRKYSK